MAVNPIPDGYHTITPYLAVKGASALVDFIEKAFGGRLVETPMKGPDGAILHAELQIGDSRLMVGEARNAEETASAMLHLYVPDCDAAFKRAVAAGGIAVREPENMFYGDRSGGLKDTWGNQWWLGTHIEDVAPAEMERRLRDAMKKRAAEGGAS